MVVVHRTSSGIQGLSDTPSASDYTNMPTSVIPSVYKANNTRSQSLEFIRSHNKPTVSSAPSSVRRKPLPPNATCQATSLSPPKNLVLRSELPSQVPSLPPVAIDVSIFNKVDFPPWEDTNFSLSCKEGQGCTGQNSNNSQRNTLPSRMSQSLAISKSLGSPSVSPKHSRASSSASVLSKETNICFANPSSTILSNTSISVPSVESTPLHKISQSLSCPQGVADSDSSVNSSSMTSPKPSTVASLFSWREFISTPVPSTSTSIESGSPKSEFTPEEKYTFLSHFGNSNKKLSVDAALAINVKSEADLQATKPLANTTKGISAFCVEDMEKELKEISSELAASIKRELELEDEVDRLKAEVPIPTAISEKRTSDYFSDSGSSSIKYGDESESKRDELDRLIRKTELSKAQMRLELTHLNLTVSEERAKCKQLEQKIQNLEEKASHINHASMNSSDASERIQELENTCEELRKRLSEEQKLRQSSDEMLKKLKFELQLSQNERDDLQYEVVPQLRSQVEGLELQATEHEKITYKQTKMQQELHALNDKTVTMDDFPKKKTEIHDQIKTFDKFSQIVEATDIRDMISKGSGQMSVLRPRSWTVEVTGNRDGIAERIRDIKLQRDALHDSLKSLRERQEHQNRENQKHIKHLETELEKALSMSPKRSGYEREVKQLRSEVNTLRLRADEAISQKFKFKENLTELKYELERAEQEIVKLKKLLMLEKHVSQLSRKRPMSGILVSESLEHSYRDLQITFSKSLEQVKSIHMENMTRENLEAFRLIEESFANAVSERNFISRQAEIMRMQNKILLENEKSLSSQELIHAKELLDSAKRFEDLAVQVRQQLNTNAALRHRLTSMIECEEKEQELSSEKIKYLQDRVKTLEDQLYLAQNSSEERLLAHEEEVREMKEFQIDQFHRIKEGIRSPSSSAFSRSIKSLRNPLIYSPVAEDIKVAQLRQKISELEKALSDADQEIAKVVSHMNAAQIQVLNLQNEREEAIKETKRLQKMIEQEKSQAHSMSWTSMLSFRGREVKV
ncbi:putative intracellular protein transport-like protein [Erysiphe necator]|uniref:Putative intracellular protein transport-like protein n=1 Tax=Uncinula necator TaxID=52586 RepID=A0A0B1P0I8_UNCNE|nr:putative intracellular protein transport-like protein [Erysiphe necator]